MAAMQLTRTHRILIGTVVAGAVVIAGIGFAGSYAAVRDLAERKGFGDFALVFPIGIDAGICVLLALDLLLTWMRIPFPMLRQTAWLLTIATIAFNGAASWPDPLGVGMHAVIPVLFVVTVEAARHAIGRIADITADKHMEGVRLTRWLLSPVPTFKLWRRMKLWELRSYEQVIKLEQERLIYQARLQARYGRSWRRKAPVESLMPLRLAKYGVPLAETAPAGLAAAGVDPVLLPPAPRVEVEADAQAPGPAAVPVVLEKRQLTQAPQPQPQPEPEAQEKPVASTEFADPQPYEPEYEPEYEADERQRYEEYQRFLEYQRNAQEGPETNPWFRQGVQRGAYEGGYDPQQQAQAPQQIPQQAPQQVPAQVPPQGAEPEAEPIRIPAGPGGRTRILGDPDHERPEEPEGEDHGNAPRGDEPRAVERLVEQPVGESSDVDAFYDAAYPVYVAYAHEHGNYPKADVLDIHLGDVHGITHPRSATLLRQVMPAFRQRMEAELEAEHIA
ncbi:DUF2637 domain-containing protein [Streptomyces sp. NPDC048057]|uniref:DUF2637 domain-containing protein n=1 Tax=Streptomyces sp. NPDC048057 TaxID=3155628 RepID=UPI0033C7CF5C